MFKKIYIEITNRCNLNCSFCIGNKRANKNIKEEEFKILLDKLEGYTKYLYFHVMGEPLMHPLINKLILMASKRYFVNITTNGYLIERLDSQIPIRQLNISLHSFQLKYGKSLDKYINDIFNKIDDLVNNGTIINFRLWVGNEYKDKIIDKLNEHYKVNIGDLNKLKLSNNVFFEIEEEFIWPSYDNDYWNKEGSCRGTRDHIAILVDGTVVPCCLDSEGIISLGNIYKQNLNDIISSVLFKEINLGFRHNVKVHPLCQKCNFYELRR